MRVSTFGSVVTVLCFASVALADDWPQWMGPRRGGVWRETGIGSSIPEAGLPVKWRATMCKVWIGSAFRCVPSRSFPA